MVAVRFVRDPAFCRGFDPIGGTGHNKRAALVFLDIEIK